MDDAVLILCLLTYAMLLVSLISPRVGLFFAASAYKTRWWGLAFWSLAIISSSMLCRVVIDAAKGGVSTSFKVITFLFVVWVISIAFELRRSGEKEKKGPPKDGIQKNTIIDSYVAMIDKCTARIDRLRHELLQKRQNGPHGEIKIEPAPVTPTPSQATTKAAPESLITVASHTDASQEYALDITALSCTCPDWIKRRKDQPPNHPSRLCKHLTEYLGRRPVRIPEVLRPYQDIIKKQGNAARGMPVAGEDCAVDYGDNKGNAYMIEASVDSYPWVSINIGSVRYGYNVDERRWAYGNKPVEVRALVKKARDLAATVV